MPHNRVPMQPGTPFDLEIATDAGPRRVVGERFGDGPRIALCLHGFPDSCAAMRGVADAAVEAGFTAFAPMMPGYDASTPLEAPRITALGQHVLDLGRALAGDSPVAVVGHDWGAVAGYAAAAMQPDALSHLVTLAVPPLSTAVREMPANLAQLRRSAYMAFFQLGGLAEWRVRKDDFALIDTLWQRWSPGWSCPPDLMHAAKAAIAAAGTTPALTYYRAMRPPTNPLHWGRARADLAVASTRISVPTVVLNGGQDGCMGRELFESMETAFDGAWQHFTVEGTGHWLHLERPEAVHAPIVDWLHATRPGRAGARPFR